MVLTLGMKFMQPIDLTPNVRDLKIDCENYHIINNLTNTVEHLLIRNNFNLPLDNIPNGVTKITIKNIYYNYKHLIPKIIIEK